MKIMKHFTKKENFSSSDKYIIGEKFYGDAFNIFVNGNNGPNYALVRSYSYYCRDYMD